MAEDLTSGGDASAVAPATPAAPVQPEVVAEEPSHEANLPVPVAQAARRVHVGGLLLAALVVVAVWVPLQWWGLGGTTFHTKGEPREALMVQSIVRDGEWVLPRRNGVELPAKPPLFHWLGALASRVHGTIDEGSVRLPSALCSLAASLIVLVTGTVAWSVLAGLTAALGMLTSFEWLRAATSARVDMTLTLGLTAALCGLLLLQVRRGRLAAWVVALGCAWAVLAKGPVGIALPLLLAVAMCIVTRSLHLFRSVHILRSLVIVGVIAGAWYGFAFAEGGPAFFQKQILTENVWRFVGTSRFTEGHRHSALYLFVSLLAGLLPWTILFPSVGAALWRTRRMIGRYDPQLFLLVWVVVVFAFYAVASSKRGVYLLALYPALFLLLGWWVHTARESVVGRRQLARVLPPLAWPLAWLFGAVAVMVALDALGFPITKAIPDLIGERAGRDARAVVAALGNDPRSSIALFAIACAAAAMVALCAAQERWTALVAALIVCTASISVAVRLIVMPAIAQEGSRRTFNDSLRRLGGVAPHVGAYRSFDYGFVFYWGENVTVVEPPLSAESPPLLVAGEEGWARATPMERRLYQRVPFIESARGGNVGRLLVLQRRAHGG